MLPGRRACWLGHARARRRLVLLCSTRWPLSRLSPAAVVGAGLPDTRRGRPRAVSSRKQRRVDARSSMLLALGRLQGIVSLQDKSVETHVALNVSMQVAKRRVHAHVCCHACRHTCYHANICCHPCCQSCGHACCHVWCKARDDRTSMWT